MGDDGGYEEFFDAGAEEEMELDYLQHLLECDEDEGPMPDEDEENPVAPPQPAASAGASSSVINALNKPPSSTLTSTSSLPTKPAGLKFNHSSSARNPTPAEFALELQKVRSTKSRSGTDASAAHAMLNITDMITERLHSVPSVVGAGDFLHKFCEETSAVHIACILGNGSRFYLRKRVNNNVVASSSSSSSGGGAQNLLSKSMAELQKEADRIQTEVLADRKLREEAKREAELYGTNLPGDDSVATAGLESALRQVGNGEKSLWVEKYAPKSFSQLLSEEKLNREVLGALKAWSPYVFRSTTTSASSGGGAGAVTLSAGIGTLGGGGIRSAVKEPMSASKKRAAGGGEESGADDDDGGGDDDEEGGLGSAGGAAAAAAKHDTRPFHKALLICGPPGTGKTTLAHVVARHCGYRPLEVNASDDRSHDVLKDTLTRAMHGNTVTGDRQPNCIILDEIDGIDGKNSIDMLVKMIRAPLRVKGQKGGGGGGGKGNKNASNATPITRPLICICNDQYAPSLRELRKFSRIFVFHPPTELRLVARLKAICAFEKISNVSPHSLTALASATGNDIRSAINTLQFAALRTSALKQAAEQAPGAKTGPQAAATSGSFGSMLSSMISSGLKDVNRDAFQVWREIFSVREMALAAAKRKSILSSSNNGNSSGKSSGTGQQQAGLLAAKANSGAGSSYNSGAAPGPEAAMQAMADFGDSNLILGGIFHNLLSIRYNDPSMTRSQLASDWISAVDQFDCFASGSGGNVGSGGGNSDSVGYQLMPYISSVAGAMHLYCAADEKVKISWPTSDKDAYYKRKSKGNILETLLNSAKLGTFCMRGKIPVVLDVLSFVVDITTPKVRPVSLLTLTQPEQEAVVECVQVMASVGLSYTSAHPAGMMDGSFFAGGHNSLSLEPAISELLSFATKCDDLKNRHLTLPAEIKSLVNMELKKFIISSRIKAEEENVTARGKQTPARGRNSDSNSHSSSSSSSSKKRSPADTLESPGGAKKSNTAAAGGAKPTQPVAGKQPPLDEAAEEAQTKRMRLGRMDMFCKKENKANIPIRPKAAGNTQAVAELELAAKLKREGSNIRFKFKEGYSNAVRRGVPISDFL